ncbi:MAG TPA: 23S rRNA (adenine(2503)-C(2))-methyltransferase RlmN, partial [Flavobacteriales bacterium]|nr:23S rRNA (adenine(2503)-C(2))-methyltransferase RlmN [Flavobacteriales bacterium]
MSSNLQDLRELSREEVGALVAQLGEKPYRAAQVWEWLWKKFPADIDGMSNLSKAFREQLKERAVLRPVVLAEQQKSTDG